MKIDILFPEQGLGCSIK